MNKKGKKFSISFHTDVTDKNRALLIYALSALSSKRQKSYFCEGLLTVYQQIQHFLKIVVVRHH